MKVYFVSFEVSEVEIDWNCVKVFAKLEDAIDYSNQLADELGGNEGVFIKTYDVIG